MKRRDLLRRIRAEGCVLIRRGSRHDWYQNPRTGMCQPIPRHSELKEPLARHICEMLKDGNIGD